VPAYEHAWPEAALDAVGITLNLYESVRTQLPESKLVVISSAEVYGAAFNTTDGPLNETAIPMPVSVYGAAKLTMEHFAHAVNCRHGTQIVVLRPFNHIGPRQSADFVCASLAEQVARIEIGLQDSVIRAGNLDTERDFTDVRDMVRAYILAARYCMPNVPYNICTGRAVSIRALIDTYMELTDVNPRIVSDPELQRKVEIGRVHGDCTRFRECTGWVPTYTIEQSLKDILHYWRNRVASADRSG